MSRICCDYRCRQGRACPLRPRRDSVPVLGIAAAILMSAFAGWLTSAIFTAHIALGL